MRRVEVLGRVLFSRHRRRRTRQVLEAAEQAGAKRAVIDTPPHTADTALMAAREADLILIPCHPSTVDLHCQRLAILEYARKHDFRIDDFIEATASGQAPEKRRRLDELMNVLQRGDRLVVSELSRLGRSLGQIVAILDALAKAGAAFVAIKENIRVDGKRDIQTKVMTTLFALFAEVERDLISERTREGLARGVNDSGRALGALRVWREEVEPDIAPHLRPSATVAVRLALVHEFRTRSVVLISSEAGAKGLNLQFCDTVVNYDLPWNPQRIEQRIGRCHRYGQRRDARTSCMGRFALPNL